MLLKWLRRAAAVTRKRLRLGIQLLVAQPLTGSQKRHRLIESGRRNRAVVVSASVVELPAQSSGYVGVFVQPTLLVLQMAHIGDFVLSLRAAQRLREGFPNSEITLVCASWNIDWAKKTGLFDHFIAFDFFSRLNKDWDGAKSDVFARFEALHLDSFDIAIDLRHDADTRPCLYRVGAKVRAGYIAPVETGYPPLDLMLPDVELLPLSNGREYSLHAELRLNLLADAVVSAYSNGNTHPIALMAKQHAAPAASRFAIMSVSAGDPIRRWPQARFVELGQRLVDEYDFDVIVVGGLPERSIVEAIVAGLPSGRVSSCIDLPLSELTTRVEQASLLVGLGSGVTHLAAALGVPTVCILSGVSPLDVWRPVGPRVINLTGETPCSPCGLKREEDCPFGVTCLKSIWPDRVLVAVKDLQPLPQHQGRARREQLLRR